MTSIKVRLNTFRATKNGSYPLVFQILHKRKKKVIYSSYHLYSEFFDNKMMKIVNYKGRKCPHADEINEYIDSTVHSIESTLSFLEEQGRDFSVSDIVELYKSNKDNSFVIVYMRNLIMSLKDEGKTGTANAYQSTLNCLLRYLGKNRCFCFNEITVKWLNQFISWLHKADLKTNTVNFYLRILRAVYNRAYNEGVSGVCSFSPFRKISLASAKTTKRAIDSDSINQIVNATIDSDNRLVLARDLFLFSFYSRGMSFVDMAFLKYSNISDGVIYYIRSKTKQPIRVKLVEPLQEIIEKYRNRGEYVFPILNSGSKKLYNQYRSGLKRYNNHLRNLSLKLNLERPLTSYVARHSWATLARNSGVPVSVISEGLGHNTEKITYTYLASLDPFVLDSANENIIKLYSRKK
ncbi:MAG: Tyrosine type site-specific recombinase [Bacteroidetes bacterium]|nr:Tyrosine type site-specific recombinase [Bacteroidota bacterium]